MKMVQRDERESFWFLAQREREKGGGIEYGSVATAEGVGAVKMV